MIIGIGNDLVEIKRVEKACEKENFLKKYYTEAELVMCNGKAAKLAGNFAVKEAVVKAFGTGFREIEAKEIEVLRDELGKPYVNLYDDARALYDGLEATAVHVAITNTDDYVSAMAVLEK